MTVHSVNTELHNRKGGQLTVHTVDIEPSGTGSDGVAVVRGGGRVMDLIL